MTKYEFLITYAPPYPLMDWLCRIFDAKKEKSQPAPEAWENWLNVWRETLADAESQLINDLNSVMTGDQLELLSEPSRAVNGIVANGKRKVAA